ncbi:MAG: peptidylprolyl isomerase [Candidatus Omnitrophica bacterium]|nr:peptidylprolyl isomerase [Candidatus Omnitrophota bacterium]
MNRIFTFLITIIIYLLFCVPSIAQEEQVRSTQKILAVINSEPITQIDVDEILAPIYQQYKNTYSGKELEAKLEVARADILNQLIGDKLILQEAKKKELRVDAKEVDKLVGELKSNFKTIEEFDKVLKEQNVTLNDLSKRYEEQLLIKKAVGQEVLSKIIISPADISNYYEKNKEKFTVPKQIRLRNIFLSVKNNEEEILQKANNIYEQLQKGTAFIELVEKYSDAPNVVDSGDMGFIKRGSFREEIEDIVFNLEVGDFTKPLKTSSGFYLFKVIEKKEASIPALEIVQEKIHSQLFGQAVEKKVKEWVNKLKESALIEVKKNEKEK